MGMFFSAWAGDNAIAPVIGRVNNTVLITIALTDKSQFPSQFLTETTPIGDGFKFFSAFRVCCLAAAATPFRFSARDAVVIGCTPLPLTVLEQGSDFSSGTSVFLIELGQVVASSEGVRVPWQPGINLFSELPAIDFSGSASTIATAIIDDKVTIINVD
jgi:hypothetical protein